jgi:hypothetical protein
MRDKKETKQFMLRIEAELLEKIKQLAEEQERTATQQINFMLKQQIRKNIKEKSNGRSSSVKETYTETYG